MFKHYSKFAFRNFRSNKLIAFGSIFTLGLGTLCIALIASFLYTEMSVNNFHKHEKEIFIPVLKSSPESRWESSSTDLFLKINYLSYPEVKTITKVMNFDEGDISLDTGLKKEFPQGIVSDSAFFKVFDFKLVQGNEDKALSATDAMVISQKLATKLFGKENPIGKTITVGTYMSSDYQVTGILDQIPGSSNMEFDFVIANSYVPNQFARIGTEFLVVNENFDQKTFVSKIQEKVTGSQQFSNSIIGFKPFTAAYFNEENVDYQSVFKKYGDKKTLYILAIILIVIAIITALNISNLQIINTNVSASFIVMSIIQGANKKQVVYQKLTALLYIILITSTIVVFTYYWALPFINGLIPYQFDFPIWKVACLSLLITSALSISSLIFPLLGISKISIVRSLKNKAFFEGKLTGKKGIIVAQFALTFVLLIASLIVVKQLDYMLNKDLGFNDKNTIRTTFFKELSIPVALFSPPNKDASEEEKIQRKQQLAASRKEEEKQKANYRYVKDQLAQHSSIKAFDQGDTPIDAYDSPWKLNKENQEYRTQNTLTVQPGFKDVFDFKLVEGRFFDETKDEAYGNRLVINEAAKKYYGITDINDAQILNQFWSDDPNDKYHVVGVVKDFNYQHLSFKPKPLVMVYFGGIEDEFIIRFNEGSINQGLQFVESLFNEVNPGESFMYSFLEDEIASLYSKEKQLSILYMIFTVLALVISLIGLFTIALYDTNRRIKEIGIRKVNGAKTKEVLVMLTKDFSKYVLKAFLIACPIAYLIMSNWLENFAYRTSISWWIFIGAGAVILITSIFTVSWHSYTAARSNPVKSLRTE